MNLPLGSNSRSCAAVAMYDGPVLLPREKTKTLPLELTATPAPSPKYMSGGSLSGLGTDSNGIVGGIAGCCAPIGIDNAAKNTAPANTFEFMGILQISFVGRVLWTRHRAGLK